MRKYLALALMLVAVPMTALEADVNVAPVTTAPAASTAPGDLPDKITPTTPPTFDLAQKLIEATRYEDAGRVISRLLLMDPIKANYDRQATMMLRVECQLHAKQNLSAIETLESVRVVAQKAADKNQEAAATALKYLVQHSPTGNYVPMTGATKLPINIIEPATRSTALAALSADQTAQLQAKIADGKTSGSISGMLDIAATAHLVHSLCVVTHGDVTKLDDSLKKLPALAAQQMRTAIEGWDGNIRSISMSAGKFESRQTGTRIDAFGSHPIYTNSRAGLSAQDVANLQGIEGACDRIPEIIADLVSAFGNADAYVGRGMKLETRASDVKRKAADVLKTDYSR